MSPARDPLRVKLYRRSDRWYGDFRHLGGGREGLIPEGASRATRDQLVAHQLYVQRARELLDASVARQLGIARRISLGEAGTRWIAFLQDEAAVRGKPRPSSLRTIAGRLTGIVGILGAELPLARLDAPTIEGYARERERSGRARATVLAEVSVIAQLLRWAVRHRFLAANPAREIELPRLEAVERPFLEPAQVGYLLRAAERVSATAAALVAFGALAGLRRGEIVGLAAEDIDREAGVIHVRPNAWRTLKTAAARRDVPIWPQLRAYLPARIAGPLFEGKGARRGGPMANTAYLFRGVVAEARRLAARDGVPFPAAHLTPHTLRHTYTAMRLQTVDAGEPVALFTVMRELGWTALHMVERVYGHLPKDRRRLDRVEYPMPSTRAAVRRA